MTKQEFIIAYYEYARQAEKKTGVPLLFALAQSALESGWGKHKPGNMLFGIKVGNNKTFGGWKGDKQLLSTTEYGSNANLKFPEIMPGYPVKEGLLWKYLVKDYFRAYPSPLYSFLDWSGLISTSSTYKKAMKEIGDPYRFAEAVAQAGYATDPNYATKIKKLMNEIAGLTETLKKKKHL
jgi:flagellum-specific peptidoglycan hydrolase FlgJ